MRKLLLLLLLPLAACWHQQGSEGGPTGRPLLGPLKLRGFGPRVAVSDGTVAVIRNDGTLWAWGWNLAGQVGIHDDLHDYILRPALVDAGHNWHSVVAGSEHFLALRRDGTLWAWGPNRLEVLGISNASDPEAFMGANAPVRVGTALDWVAVRAGEVHSLARRADGSLWSWGTDNQDQLGCPPWPGPGDEQPHDVPALVEPAGRRWGDFAGGTNMTLAVDDGGTLWAWGSNDGGELGLPQQHRGELAGWGEKLYPHPQPVRGGRPWRRVAAGSRFGAGIRRDGSLWLWGVNHDMGRVGTPADTAWVALAAGSSYCLALRRDGTLWSWDQRDAWNEARFYQFRQVGTGRQWRDAAIGDQTLVGLQADGSVWVWGTNHMGQFGNGTKDSTNTYPGRTQPGRVTFPPAPGGDVRM